MCVLPQYNYLYYSDNVHQLCRNIVTRKFAAKLRTLLGIFIFVTDKNPALYTACTQDKLVRDMIYQISGIKAFTQGYIGAKSLCKYIDTHQNLVSVDPTDNLHRLEIQNTCGYSEYESKIRSNLM